MIFQLNVFRKRCFNITPNGSGICDVVELGFRQPNTAQK